MADILETLADPTRPHDAIRAARERLGQGDLDDAERAIRFALDFNPNDTGLLLVLSDVSWRRGHYAAWQSVGSRRRSRCGPVTWACGFI